MEMGIQTTLLISTWYILWNRVVYDIFKLQNFRDSSSSNIHNSNMTSNHITNFLHLQICFNFGMFWNFYSDTYSE